MTSEDTQLGEAVNRPKCWFVGHGWASNSTQGETKWCKRCGKEAPWWYSPSPLIGPGIALFFIVFYGLYVNLKRWVSSLV